MSKTYRIACIPGDGIGKEVIPAGQAVLEALAASQPGLGFAFTSYGWGGDWYRAHGEMMPADGLQRISDVPIYFADPLVRRAQSLQKTTDAAEPTARLSGTTLERLGLATGLKVRVRQDSGEAVLTVQQDDHVPADCVRIAAAHASTATLGDMFATINVERA